MTLVYEPTRKEHAWRIATAEQRESLRHRAAHAHALDPYGEQRAVVAAHEAWAAEVLGETS